MNKKFYESVTIPDDLSKSYDRIFYLRNLFQDPELFKTEMLDLEKELVALLPVLEEPEQEIETYDAGELSQGDLMKLYKEDIRPIVIRGYGKNHDSVKKWTPDFLKEHYGDYKIFFTSTEKIVNDLGTNLSDFVDQIISGSKNYDTPNP